MRIMYFIITLVICFCTTTLQAENRANDLMKQAQSSLEQKDYTKARYLFLQAYKAFSTKETTRKPSTVEQKQRIFIIARTTIRKHSNFAAK